MSKEKPDSSTLSRWVLTYNQDRGSEIGLRMGARIENVLSPGDRYLDTSTDVLYEVVGIAENIRWFPKRSARDSFMVTLQPVGVRRRKWYTLPLTDFFLTDVRLTPHPSAHEGPVFVPVKKGA